MINIVLLTHNRARLLRQAIVTLYANTPTATFNLTVVDDYSTDPAAKRVFDIMVNSPGYVTVQPPTPSHVLAQAKNHGVSASSDIFGRGDYLLLCDNDIALLDNWYKTVHTIFRDESPDLLGGCRHPFHLPNKRHKQFVETDAVAGYFMMMRWDTWDKYGPLCGNAGGISQSEDWAFSRKIVEDGGKVGYAEPAVMLHCGITDSNGNAAVGADKFFRPEGYVYA